MSIMGMEKAQRGIQGGMLDSFSGDFNAFETQHLLFEKLVDEQGFAWWDLARYSVQFAICRERGILGQRRVGAEFFPARAVRAAKRGAALVKANVALALFSPRARKSINSHSELFVYSRLTPVFKRSLEESGGHAVRVGLPKSGTGRASHGLTKKGLEALVSWRARFAVCPPDVSREAERVSRLLNSTFGSQIDFAALITSKYRAHQVERLIWQRILAPLSRSGTIHFINDDTTRTLTALAKARGMRTREYQHAYMGRNHFAYNHPPQAHGLSTLPDEVLVHRDTGDIVVPTLIIPVDEPVRSIAAGPRSIDVLVGGSPVYNCEAMAIVAALVDRGFALTLKLHPSQSLASSGMRRRFSSAQLTICDGKEDFATLASRSRVYIPANPTSTTTYEAVERGARLVVVEFGERKVTSTIDGLVTARVGDVTELASLLADLFENE